MIFRLLIAVFFNFFLVNTSCMTKQADRDTLTIEFYKIPCSGEGNQWCLLVKSNQAQQQYFHGEIKGFKYEWGYRYTILAEKIRQLNAPADATTLDYRLIKVLHKEKISSITTFELPLQMDDATLVKRQGGKFSIMGVPIIQNSGFTIAAISKAGAGIFIYQTGNQPGLVLKALKP